MLCPCSGITSKPSFSCIYQNESQKIAFQYFQQQLSFPRSTEQFEVVFSGDTAFQKGHSNVIPLLKSKFVILPPHTYICTHTPLTG